MSGTYVERVMLPDERLEYVGRIHWIIFMPGVLSALGGALLCLFPFRLLNHFLFPALIEQMRDYILFSGLSAVGAGLLLIINAYLRMISTELVVTNIRVIAKTGFISRNTFEIMLSRIEGANIEQTVWGRLLNFGSIYVHGTGGGITPIDHVADPLPFKKQLLYWQERHDQNGGGKGGANRGVNLGNGS